MARKIFHVHLDVRGAIRWPNRKLKGLVGDENGDRFTADEARDWLMDQLARGRECLPIGKKCKGFNYKTGCPGHPEPEPLAASAPSEHGREETT